MELSWSTFLLEIINFLVLVWILKRFLYKPVLDVIARRRSGIEDQLSEARRLHDEAVDLKAEYDARLSEWEKERERLREALAKDIDAERTRQMEALQATLEKERVKAKVAESKRRAAAEHEVQRQALQQGAQFATRLLSEAAGPDLEVRLTELLLDGLDKLSADQVSALRTQWGEPPENIHIASAFPLTADRRQQLETALRKVTGLDVQFTYVEDSGLMAGLRISIGAWVLQVNLQDELRGFKDFSHAVG